MSVSDREGRVYVVCIMMTLDADAAHFAFEIWTRFEFIAGHRQ